MKLDIEAMAWEAGFAKDDVEAISQLFEAFARLIVERCAQEAEDTSQEYEAYTGQELALNYSCATAIRNLLEN